MIHNGIEYGLMQAYAEGFSIMEHKKDLDLDLEEWPGSGSTGASYAHGCSDLTVAALKENPSMSGIAPHVSGLGRGALDGAGGRSTSTCPRR
jgi:6-phosphogluconate dehydrogenase